MLELARLSAEADIDALFKVTRSEDRIGKWKFDSRQWAIGKTPAVGHRQPGRNFETPGTKYPTRSLWGYDRRESAVTATSSC